MIQMQYEKQIRKLREELLKAREQHRAMEDLAQEQEQELQVTRARLRRSAASDPSVEPPTPGETPLLEDIGGNVQANEFASMQHEVKFCFVLFLVIYIYQFTLSMLFLEERENLEFFAFPGLVMYVYI